MQPPLAREMTSPCPMMSNSTGLISLTSSEPDVRPEREFLPAS